jgi:aminobenzoyl-glutamate transport protein
MESASVAERRLLIRFLDAVERVGNKLPDPITLFALLALGAVLVSWLAAVHPGTGETVVPVNLLTAEQIRRMFTQAVANFTAFPPLGLVIVVIIGIGVTEHSGLIGAALRRLVSAVPESLLTATVVFAGVMSSMAVDAATWCSRSSARSCSLRWDATRSRGSPPRSRAFRAGSVPTC